MDFIFNDTFNVNKKYEFLNELCKRKYIFMPIIFNNTKEKRKKINIDLNNKA